MGNQNGKTADRSVDGIVGRSPLRTKVKDVPASAEHEALSGEKAGEGTSAAPVEAPTEEPIDKYQVVETAKDLTLEVSTMATEVGSSTPLDLKEGKDKAPFIDISEVDEGTKDDAKSALVSTSDETTDLKNKSVEIATHDEKPSNVSAAEKETLLGKGASDEQSESVTSEKKLKLTHSSSFFKSCLFCIPNATS